MACLSNNFLGQHARLVEFTVQLNTLTQPSCQTKQCETDQGHTWLCCDSLFTSTDKISTQGKDVMGHYRLGYGIWQAALLHPDGCATTQQLCSHSLSLVPSIMKDEPLMVTQFVDRLDVLKQIRWWKMRYHRINIGRILEYLLMRVTLDVRENALVGGPWTVTLYLWNML